MRDAHHTSLHLRRSRLEAGDLIKIDYSYQRHAGQHGLIIRTAFSYPYGTNKVIEYIEAMVKGRIQRFCPERVEVIDS